MNNFSTFPFYQNMEEIKKISDLICDYLHPEMVILFGQYAGMPPTTILGGYEFLVIIQESTSILVREVRHYINLNLSLEERREKNLSLNIFTANLVIHKSYISYFLLSIRQHGLLMYTNHRLNLFKKVHCRPVRLFEFTSKQTSRCLSLGKAFLENAQYNWDKKVFRLTAFQLYHASSQFLLALLYAHFGFVPDMKEDILTLYSYIRYCSEELNGLCDGNNNLSGWRLFSRLQNFNTHPLFSEEFYISSLLLSDYLKKLQLFQIATENFCQDKLSFLKTL